MHWKPSIRLTVSALISIIVSVESLPTINPSDFTAEDVIVRDVCIVGGGSSGTYAAVRLGDLGSSVVVVESEDRLGGMTQTYVDPATNIPVDIGVEVWHNLTIVKDYFARFDVALVGADSITSNATNEYADFRTGKLLAGYTAPDPTDALSAYAVLAGKYSYLDTGFYLPDPVPEDLLLPFGEFVTKYSLEGFVPFVFTFAEGFNDLLNQLTIYVMKYIGPNILNDLATGFLTTAKHDNSLLYEAATEYLGDAVMLNSKVVAMDREGAEFTNIVVQQRVTGRQILIRAKKILITIPPVVEKLSGFDLDDAERSLFTQFSSSGYYTALLRNTGFPNNISFLNNAVNTPYNLPPQPSVYSFAPTAIPGVQSVFYGGPSNLTDAFVQADIIKSVRELQKANNLPETTPTFAIYSSHTPFELTVPADAIAAGFYSKLYALQGLRNTFYTGAAFHAYDSSLLWEFTEALLPKIVAS